MSQTVSHTITNRPLLARMFGASPRVSDADLIVLCQRHAEQGAAVDRMFDCGF